jgi:phospholipid/cholesterol/gamma-HCH transport system substrate-binding protein
MGRRTLINLVFFLGVFALMIFWALNNIVTFDRIERPYQITGEFEQAVGVHSNAEVTFLGVHYGRVGKVERDERNHAVKITMKIDRTHDIPTGSIARIFRKSAIGEPYIDFVPPEKWDGSCDRSSECVPRKGGVIPIDDTRIPLEFSEFLKSASKLLSNIDPHDAGVVVHELAAALDGRGDSLHQLTEAADKLTASFVTKTAELDRLATNNTRLTKVFADHRASLGSAITNLRQLSASLKNAKGDLAVVLDEGGQLLGLAADLVSDEKRNLDCILHNAQDLIGVATTPEQLAGLATDLTKGPTAFGYVWATRDDEPKGVWVRVNLIINLENKPNQYVPMHELPIPPAVPACASTLSATSGPRFTPTASGGATTGELPATGGEPLALAALFLVVGAFATWRLRTRADA